MVVPRLFHGRMLTRYWKILVHLYYFIIMSNLSMYTAGLQPELAHCPMWLGRDVAGFNLFILFYLIPASFINSSKMPRSFDILPYDVLVEIVSHVPILDYYALKLAGCRPLTDVIRDVLSRIPRTQYLDTIRREDARQKGLPEHQGRRPMEILIERGRLYLILDHKGRFSKCSSKLVEYDAGESEHVVAVEKTSLSPVLHWAALHGEKEIALLLIDRVNLRAGFRNRTALHYAVVGNQLKMAQLLLDHGAYINAADDKGKTPLALAVEHRADDVAALLQSRGGQSDWLAILRTEEWARPITNWRDGDPDPMDSLEAFQTHLTEKILRGCPQLRAYLKHFHLRRVGDLEQMRSHQTWVVHQSLMTNDTRMIEFMIEEGWDVHKHDGYFLNALYVAVSENKLRAVELMLDHGADPTIPGPRKDYIPLHVAVYRHRREILDLMLSRGFSPNARNGKGETVLHKMVRLGTFGSPFDYAVAQGVDLNLRDSMGNTPLRLAVHLSPGHIGTYGWGVVEKAVKLGADVNIANNQGETPFLSAMRRLGHGHSVKFLLEHGADVKAVDHAGRGAFHYGISNTYGAFGEYFKLLVDLGVDINLRDKSGCTPLHDAAEDAEYWYSGITLLPLGADVNARTNTGDTPLHRLLRRPSITAKQYSFCCKMLEFGADVNAGDAGGYSPLLRFLQACEVTEQSVGYLKKTIELLLQKGADMDGFDEDGNSTQDLYIDWKKQIEAVEGKHYSPTIAMR